MKEEAGRIFEIAKDNLPVPGCTVSKAVSSGTYDISYFSMAPGTDISAETYTYPKLWIVLSGDMTPEVKNGQQGLLLQKGQVFLTPVNIPVGNKTQNGCVYTEITLKEDSNMNSIVRSKEIFALKDLLPYEEGKIVNMDIIHDSKLKLVVMSFFEGTGLSEHAAPGEALIFALDGEAIIGYEGQEYRIKAGENFKFDKNGAHFIRADHNFKMALLLTLE